MAEVDNNEPVPAGFKGIAFAGIGLSCKMIEPASLSSPSDWELIVSELTSWGDVPNPEPIEVSSLSEDERGPRAVIRGDCDWLVEFLPWGSDGLIRKRSTSADSTLISPSGGYSWNGTDVAILWKSMEDAVDSRNTISDSMKSGDLNLTKQLLWSCGESLALYHREVKDSRTTPPDPRRWNARLSVMEERLRADLIWRAPHSRDSECMLSLGDVRLSDFLEGKVRIRRPRRADALVPSDCEFPAIRDLASISHDLSRLHHELNSEFDIVELRTSMIQGWMSRAPEKWCSASVFYTHRGGLAIWEYEQCLLDVLEAVSDQSGAPEPATGLIRYVKKYQMKMFNSRIFATLSMMFGALGAITIIRDVPTSIGGLAIPALFISGSYILLRFYWSLSPRPEIPFNLIS